MGDGIFIHMPNYLARSKMKDWHERWMLRGVTLADFLVKNDLIKEEFVEAVIPLAETTVIKMSQLKTLGLAFYREGAIGRWYDAHDRGRPIEDTRILERGLKKVKELGPDHFLDDEWIQQWATPE